MRAGRPGRARASHGRAAAGAVRPVNGRIAKGRRRAGAALPAAVDLADTRTTTCAIRAGTVRDGFRVKGDLFDFPRRRAQRQGRRVPLRRAACEGATFDYVPSEPAACRQAGLSVLAWPAFTQVAGELAIDRMRCAEIRDARAQLGGVALAVQVNGGFLQRPVGRACGRGDGLGAGIVADMLRFVNATPVGQWTGAARPAAPPAAPSSSWPGADAARAAASTVEGQPRAGRQRCVRIIARHAAAGRRQGVHRLHANRPDGARRERCCSAATPASTARPRRRLAALQRPGHASAEGLRASATELGAAGGWPATSGRRGYRASIGRTASRSWPSPATWSAWPTCRCRWQGGRDCRDAAALPDQPGWWPTRRRTPTRATRCASSSAAWCRRSTSAELAPEGPSRASGGIGINERRCRPAACAAPTSQPCRWTPGKAWFAPGSGGNGASKRSRRGRRPPTQIALRAQTLTPRRASSAAW